MDCKNLSDFLTPADFDCIGDVARHCDLKKLCIATEEAKLFDLFPLLCFELAQEILDNWKSEDEKWKALVCGGAYTVNGKNFYNMGFKRVWIYYSYARYLLINQHNDTANGTVKKDNDWSIPTPLKEVTDFSNKYRAMGKEAFESVHAYLCRHQSDFPNFDGCNCKNECGCSGVCSCGKTKKLTGAKFSTIRK